LSEKAIERRQLLNLLRLGVNMGQNGRDRNDMRATKEQRESTPFETKSEWSASTQSTNREGRSPDQRRRTLIVGLATTPVLLSLMNRSALAQDVNCSALASVILGGSAANLPPGLQHGQGGEHNNIPDHAIENMYDAKCKDEAHGGNTNGNSNGNASGNSNNP
jgi:hypothetical protein